MPILELIHYNLRADRATLDALRDFYVNVIGLQIGARPPFHNFGYWLYIGARDVLHLSEAQADEQRPGNVMNTFHHVAFACSGLAEYEARLQAQQLRYTSERIPLTGQQQLFCHDPAGNGVELNFAEEII